MISRKMWFTIPCMICKKFDKFVVLMNEHDNLAFLGVTHILCEINLLSWSRYTKILDQNKGKNSDFT